MLETFAQEIYLYADITIDYAESIQEFIVVGNLGEMDKNQNKFIWSG